MIRKPYQGLRTFCNTSDDISKSFCVLGLPTDTATSFRPGARFGPSAIRESSMMLTDGYHNTYDVDVTQNVVDLGDANLSVGNTTKMLQEIESVVDNINAWGKHPVFLGGDHTVTLGILRAMNKKYGKVAVVHFDAHCDTWSSNFDEPIGHGTWLYNAINENLIDVNKTISIGIRSPSDKTSREFLRKSGGHTISARRAMSNISDTIELIKNQIGYDIPCYLTFDIDSLDPAYAPGTGTPEIGGLSTIWAMECIESLRHMNWIGMDCVEVCPAYDHSGITSLAASTLCWIYLSMNIFKRV